MPTGVSPSAKSSRSTGTTRWSASERVEVGAGGRAGRPWRSRGLRCVDAVLHRRPVRAGRRRSRCGRRCGRRRRSARPARAACRRRSRAPRPHVLRVAGGVALAPVLLAAARPEGDAALGEGAAERLGVHLAQHEHLAGVALLDDRRQQPVARRTRRASMHARRRLAVIVAHRTAIPSARSASLTSPIVSSPLWNTDAASTASAPAAIAGAKSLDRARAAGGDHGHAC